MAGDTDNSRKVARSATSTPVTNVIAVEYLIIVLDLQPLDTDQFILTPSSGKPITRTYADAKDLDSFHKQLQFPLPVNSKGKDSLKYTLVQRRAGKVVRTLFKDRLRNELVGPSAPPKVSLRPLMRYTHLANEPADPDLHSPWPNYSELVGSGHVDPGESRFNNKDSIEVKSAYSRAMAVIGRRCQFVEWNFLVGQAAPHGLRPWSYSVNRRQGLYEGAWSPIEGERWIYVFRRAASGEDSAASGENLEFKNAEWTEELFLDADGNISATPMDSRGATLPAPVPIGGGICFPRRIRGEALEYFFFATRIRLSTAFAHDLEKVIARYTIPVNFEVDDPGMAAFQSEGCLVPVLDPLTVALNFHRCAIAALDDCISYTSSFHEQAPGPRKQADTRLRKRLLAQLLQSITKADDSNRLYHKLQYGKGGVELDLFLADYDYQVRLRNTERERWAALLTNWLRSDPMKWLARFYQTVFPKWFWQYLSCWGNCVFGLSETTAGKNFLNEVLDDTSHWAHRVVLSTDGPPAADVFQVFRKGHAPALAAATELAKALSLRGQAKKAADVLNFAAGIIQDQLGHGFIHPGVAAVAFASPLGETKVTTTSRLHLETDFELSFRSEDQKHHGPSRKKISFLVLVEGVNLFFSGKAIYDNWSDSSASDKAFAVLNLFGSGLDFTQTILEINKSPFVAEHGEEALATSKSLGQFFRKAETIAAVGFVSSGIDTLLGIKDTVDAIQKGNAGAAAGSAAVAVGSFVLMKASLWSLVTAAEAGPVGLVGLAIVGIGYSIKVLFGGEDSDFEKLVAHSHWGIAAGSVDDTKPDWSPVPFRRWYRDYDTQLVAAVSLICKPRFSHDGDNLRFFRLDVDWLPPGCRIDVMYEELWDSPLGRPPLQAVFTMTPGGPVTDSKTLTMRPGKSGGWVIGPAAKVPLTDSVVYMNGRLFPDGLNKMSVGVILEINSGKYRFLFPGSGVRLPFVLAKR